jgi:ribonuclease P protein component
MIVQDCLLVSANASGRSGEHPSAQTGTSFPRALRLLKHSDFERVYKQGRRQLSSHMSVFFLPKADGGARVGFTVGRILGGAVQRNRIKRRLRAAVRLRQSALQGAVDIVINPKKTVLRAEFAVLLEEVGRAFTVIGKKLADR